MIPTKYIVIFQEASRYFDEYPDVLERLIQLQKQIGKESKAPESQPIPESASSPYMLSIAERVRFEGFKRMLSCWPSIRSLVRELEEAVGLPEPPCDRPAREHVMGVLPSMSISDQEVFEELRQLCAEYSWVKARATALEAAIAKAGTKTKAKAA